MSKKYKNFIVGNLVKNTEINYDQKRITFPHIGYPRITYPFLPKHFPGNPLSSPLFSDYLKDVYGAREEEIVPIWNQFIERIKSLINI